MIEGAGQHNVAGVTNRQPAGVGRRRLPAGVSVLGLVLVLLSLVGPNWPLALLASGVLMAGIWLLWRPGESPILLFVFLFAWLQASVHLYVANLKGVPAIELSQFIGDNQQATLLSLLACLAIGLGLHLGAGPWRASDGMRMRAGAEAAPLRRWFLLYLAALGVSLVLSGAAAGFCGLRQIILALASLKWAFFWMLAYATFVKRRGDRWYLAVAFFVELVLGFSGFFSGFKTVFFMTFLAFAASGFRLTPRQSVGLAVGGVILLVVGAVWSEIKVEYRQFVSGYTGQQVVIVSPMERYQKLVNLAADIDGNGLADGFEKLFSRIAYVDFFSVVLTTVPSVMPHENGKLWWDAIRRPLMPRLLFPDKKPINDSELVNKYTGLGVAGAAQGTSISLGYVAETYIDFGRWLMFVPLFLLGFAAGNAYRWYLRNPKSAGILGMAMATAVLMPLAGLETSIVKLIGALLLQFLGSLIVIYYLAPRFFPWVVRGVATYRKR